MKQVLIVWFFTLCFLITPAHADILYLKDGSILKGKITKLDNHSVEINSSAGVLTISRDQIKKSEVGETDTNALIKDKKKPSTPVKEKEESFTLTSEKSVYSERTLGFGFATGTSSGIGLSTVLYASPVSFSFTAFPLDDGYSLGTQIQLDLIQFKYQRFHCYLGGAVFNRNNEPYYHLGGGFGYGWMVAKFIGFTFNGGILGSINSTDNTSELTWGPDINFLIHFYVL
ncbi:hypothetical protein K8S19_05965 [bacterium]|nr:hypothetical protein [bacterium]